MGELLFGVKSFSEIDSSQSAVGVDLNPQSLDISSTIGSSTEIGEIELDLVPSIVHSHRHCTYERLYPCAGLEIRSSESPFNSFVIQNLKI